MWKKITAMPSTLLTTQQQAQALQQYQTGMLTEVGGAPVGLNPAEVIDWTQQMVTDQALGDPRYTGPHALDDAPIGPVSKGIDPFAAQDLMLNKDKNKGSGMDPAKVEERTRARMIERGVDMSSPKAKERLKKRVDNRT